MSRNRGLRARRFPAVAVVVASIIGSIVVAPVAAHAGVVDVAMVAPVTAVSGYAGDFAPLQFQVVNGDVDAPSGPLTVVFAVNGSTVESLYTGYGSCDVATVTCSLSQGVYAGSTASIHITLRVGTSGSVTATSALAGDTNPANDAAAVVVTQIVIPPALLHLVGPAAAVRAGSAVKLAATLTDAAGAPLANETVALMRLDVGATDYVAVFNGYTDAAGVATWQIAPTATATYKAVSAQTYDRRAGAAESTPVVVRVMFAVTAEISPIAVPPGSVIVLSLQVESAASGTPVTVQQQLGAGAWKSVAHPRLTAGGKAQVRFSTLNKVGTYTFRVIRGADATHDQGFAQSKIVVTVTGKGSVAAWEPLGGTKARPARWNPCAPIDYYINPRNMPATGLADVRETLRRLSLASGLTFRYAGRRDIMPHLRYRGPRGGILIAWGSPAETGGLLPSYAGGVGVASWIGRRIISGYLVINSSYVKSARQSSGFGAGAPQGLVLMHEMGHVLGLAHANDRWSMMHPSASLPASVWGAGDLAGLRAVGRPAGCL